MKNLLLAVLLVGGCGNAPKPDPLHTREVRLPNGVRILCEVKMRPEDMALGMMHRDSLAENRGMLFIHVASGNHPYWMHNVRVPLDIIWMDESRKIVEISENTPPCLKPAQECGNYGGQRPSQYVLEMPGGGVKRHNLKIGDAIDF